jgi:hypothetical protein
MEYDFAIIYFGLTRSVKKTYETHQKYLYDVLKKNNITYKTFMHTWKTKDHTQNVWEQTISQKIDYSEYNLFLPDFYNLDDEGEFLESINMDMYFYKDVWEKKGHAPDGEWLPRMVSNHVCMLESQKRGLSMVKSSGDKFKFIMFIRPDITIHNELPIDSILSNADKIHLPNHSHHEGKNDQFAIIKYEDAYFFGNRIDELSDFRKENGRIVGEKYCKFIISKYNMKINEIDFQYSITRP